MALASLRKRELPHPGPRGRINFLHPAYPAPTNTLLSLARVDRSGKRRSEASNADGDSVIEYSSDDSDTRDDYWDDDMMDIWERRGKRKQRQTSNQTDPHIWLENDQHLPQDANKSCVPPEQRGGQTFTQENDMHQPLGV
ncbi:hypothetical protein FQN51_006951 [Onygenales sp. PD_10]|nr:hypothetical protein FQN51_006951 [Onygenales sp. PD_10]